MPSGGVWGKPCQLEESLFRVIGEDHNYSEERENGGSGATVFVDDVKTTAVL